MSNDNFDIVPNGNLDSDNPVPNGKPNSNTDSFNLVPNGNFDIVPHGNFDLDNSVSNGKPISNTKLFNLVPNGNFDIVPNGNSDSDSHVPNGKPNNNTVSFNLVPNGNFDIVPNGNFDLDNLHSIKPPDNIVICSVIDKTDISFPFSSIRTTNGIDFTFHSHLHFDLQRWISSLLPLFRLLISSFQLDYFLLFSRHNFPSCIDLQPSLTTLQLSFPTWDISTHSLSSSSFGSKLSCYRSLIHGF